MKNFKIAAGMLALMLMATGCGFKLGAPIRYDETDEQRLERRAAAMDWAQRRADLRSAVVAESRGELPAPGPAITVIPVSGDSSDGREIAAARDGK